MVEQTPENGSNLTAFLRTSAESALEHADKVRELFDTTNSLLEQYGESKGTPGIDQTLTIKNAATIRVGGVSFSVTANRKDGANPYFDESNQYIGFDFYSGLVEPSHLEDVITIASFGKLRVATNNNSDLSVMNNLRNNTPADIADVKDILDQLQKKCQKEKQLERDKQEEQRYKRTLLRRKAMKLGKAAVGISAVAGLGWGAVHVPWGEVFKGEAATFDEENYSLSVDQAEIIHYGKTAHPGFSEDLLGNPKLGFDEMPQIGDSDETLYDGPDDAIYGLDDGYRQIIITASTDNIWGTKDEGKPNCDTQELNEPLGLESSVYAWTDFSAEDGTSRADELDVTYGKSGVKVCWTGEERNDDDDPRVVVLLQDSKE